jgi:hypothetical protein
LFFLSFFFFLKKKKTKKKSIYRSSEHIWKNYKEKLIECKFNRLIKRNQKSFLNTTVAKPSHQVPTCTNTATKMLPRTPRKNHFWRPTRYEMRQGSQASFFFFFSPSLILVLDCILSPKFHPPWIQTLFFLLSL